MKNTLTTLTFLALTIPAMLHANVTPEQISEAEQARQAGKMIGLDKMTPEQFMEIATAMGGEAPQENDLSPEEKAVQACMMTKQLDIQFRAPIEEYARYLSDNEYQEATDQSIEKDCGFNKLDQNKIADRKKNQKQKTLDKLLAKKEQADKTRKQLARFEVLDSTFYIKETGTVVGSYPVAELTVKNNTDTPVSRVFFSGIIKSPGRSVPWIQEKFNYQIPGGVEPGEKAHWKLNLNKYSAWGSVKVPEDAELKVMTTRLYGPDGKSIYPEIEFNDKDNSKLTELQQELQKM